MWALTSTWYAIGGVRCTTPPRIPPMPTLSRPSSRISTSSVSATSSRSYDLVMKPTPQNRDVKIECRCGWSRVVKEADDPEEHARYHRIQVHNDQEAVRAKPVF